MFSMHPDAFTLLLCLLNVAYLANAAPRANSCGAVDSHDFVVVGGGTAGNAVAARLSQYLPDKSIVIIEAGPSAPDEDRIKIPGLK